MSSRPDLRLDWCSYQAARYAVEKWHYSRRMPRGKLARLGVWEDGRFVGAVVFGQGAGRATDGARFGLGAFEVAELVRVALREHRTPVSRIVAIAVKMLRRQSPGLRLLVSFADPRQGHVGTIYQAAGWWYLGETEPGRVYIDRAGREHHSRTVSPRGWKPHFGQPRRALRPQDAAEIVRTPGKHIYALPLHPEMAERLERKPYPSAGSIDSDAPRFHRGEGGVSPTPALQSASG